ncbi:MAG TPA: cysteine desulfurase family protein [Actinomycetales bacterium]|nr:cysteine desulfurase family protein [Actinomycetales bacterium]
MTAYLDHAATTPMLPAAVETLTQHLRRTGNASSLHTSGRRARRVVEESREQVAAALGAGPNEVVFTSGGTEADNLAVKGLFWKRQDDATRRHRIVASAVEHHAVLDSVDWLVEHQGAEVDWVPVDAAGRIDLDAYHAILDRDPDSIALVSVMWANNEVGTLQPIDQVVAAAKRHGIPVHTDAVQAVGSVPVDFGRSGVDAMTITGHKLGGPYGAGALLLRRGVDLTPVLHGGGQERGVRSGTLDTPAIAAFAVAVDTAVAARTSQAPRIAGLREDLVAGVQARVPGAVVSGDADPAGRLPGIAHFTFTGCEGDSLLYLLDARGVECSTGSACQAGVPQPSHVLRAMGMDDAQSRGALRFSLGHTSTKADVDALLDAIGPVVERARNAGLASRAHGFVA